MGVLRTPDNRFNHLPEFPYEPKYVDLNGMRVHYVDKGEGETILCLHGEPTWSYLYRKMIPLLARYHRVLAMDFFGFGRSDKFTAASDYSMKMHCDTLKAFIGSLSLDQITLVGQDWGGIIGLSTVAELPKLFARLVILNTWLPSVQKPSEAFLAWRRTVERIPDLSIGRVIKGNLCGKVSDEVLAAYEAPFPSPEYKVGAQVWPLLAPLTLEDSGAAEMYRIRDVLSGWNKPALVMFSDGDSIVAGGDVFFRNLIPTARKEPEIVITDAGHFLQEDKGEEIAHHTLEFMARRPLEQ